MEEPTLGPDANTLARQCADAAIETMTSKGPAYVERAILPILVAAVSELERFKQDLAEWGRSIVVGNFLRDYANRCFQMQGAYDGAMSEASKASFAKHKAFTDLLLEMIESRRELSCQRGS